MKHWIFFIFLHFLKQLQLKLLKSQQSYLTKYDSNLNATTNKSTNTYCLNLSDLQPKNNFKCLRYSVKPIAFFVTTLMTCTPYTVFADIPTIPDLKTISSCPQWLKLLHFKKKYPLGSALQSEIDSKDFFLHPMGSQDALKELEATIEAFQDTQRIHHSKMSQHPQCAFPARLQFLKKYFHFESVDCEEYKEWRNKLPVKSIHMVYSTAYPNNPASSFGHTFLRLGLSDNRSELLDYAINFAADTGDVTNGFLYTMKGLFGGFNGFFSLEKYYLKVNDYNNQESRDLWEYQLPFNSEEIDLLLKHFWELYTNAYITYFFMDENCSYHLLTLLEAAKPNWNISEKFHKQWIPNYTLPADTVKETLTNSSSLPIDFRPSKRKVLLQKRDALTSDEKDLLYQLIQDQVDFKRIQNPFLLDTLIEYYDYKKRELKVSLDSPLQRKLQQLLAHRSQFGLTPDRSVAPFEKINQPELSHQSSSIGLFSGVRNDYEVTGLRYRFGLHDLLNADEGYDAYTQIDYLHIQTAYSHKKKKLYLDEVKYFDISSINTYDPVDWKWSWRVLFQTESFKSSNCEDCLKHYGFGGGGISFEIVKNKILFYTYILGLAQYSKDLRKEFQVGPAVESALLYKISTKFKLKLKHFLFENLNERRKSKTYNTIDVDLAYQVSQNWDFRLLTSFRPRNDDSSNNDYSSHLLVQYYY